MPHGERKTMPGRKPINRKLGSKVKPGSKNVPLKGINSLNPVFTGMEQLDMKRAKLDASGYLISSMIIPPVVGEEEEERPR
jgi:hypothetical protein